jgi:hypothetical protein
MLIDTTQALAETGKDGMTDSKFLNRVPSNLSVCSVIRRKISNLSHKREDVLLIWLLRNTGVLFERFKLLTT